MQKIGILGTGIVGVTLANGFQKHGYEVQMGSRQPKEVKGWKGSVVSFAEAASWGELVVLAVKGEVAKEVITSLATELAEKIVIDTTNPIDSKRQPDNGVLHFFTNLDQSLMETLQESTPQAKLVKAFSCVGNSLMVSPDFGGHTPSMFICGNDDLAKSEVSRVLEQFGWETEDMGKAEAARAIEPLCILWCIPGFLKNNWTHAFKLLKK